MSHLIAEAQRACRSLHAVADLVRAAKDVRLVNADHLSSLLDVIGSHLGAQLVALAPMPAADADQISKERRERIRQLIQSAFKEAEPPAPARRSRKRPAHLRAV